MTQTAAATFQDLSSPLPLTDEQIRHFREEGYVKLKNVLSAETLKHYGEEITRQVLRLNTNTKPLSERSSYDKMFLQVMNLWTKSDVVKEFCFGRRLAQMATELMGVKGVRMYHDQALYKEPGGTITPWHADQYYWPLSNNNVCTAWVPLQHTPMDMGPLMFSRKSHRFEFGRDLPASEENEAKLQEALDIEKFALDDGPYDLGEVSFHYGWTFHRAGPNKTNQPRAVMTAIYMEDGMKLVEPTNKDQINDWNRWMPGAKVGETIQTELNPLIYRA